ncbi:TPM domain-containing protein [Qipengyuania sp. JC766]|uniref:TPM domain-containing protein n=1 Tax=Qipengyuania sp. JC766 TaxID=3232139 RepID=UPI003458019E
MRALAILFTAFATLLTVPASAQPTNFPELSGRVVDAADIIPEETEAALNAKLAALEEQSQRQLVVATIPDLEGYEIADYGYQLGREWGIGDAERNDGALLIVAPNERRVRIEVGYGLEGIMTDALSSVIINQSILPRFREYDYPGGIVAGTDAIIQQLQLPAEEAQAVAQQASEERANDGGFPVGAIGWFIALVFFLFVLPAMFGRSRKRKYRGKKGRRGSDLGDVATNIILWEVGTSILSGALSGGDDWGGGGSGFGGGGGFGGFSGGGGSFGGGGASGGW